ncbi:MAG TPA: periplasmic heavy metal sensor [Bryobacteraceae bacterium]|jgi:Spy/CpxP family protein refolding chaperone|nr:periplasmic heavy metal sensor [Bryobacteraceae bacterium]
MRFWPILVFPGLLVAQPPPRDLPPWWEAGLTKDLNLSDAQTKQLLQIRDEFRPRMREARAAVTQAERDVDAAFNEDPVDQAKATVAINRLAAARAEATRAVSEMDLKFRMILTAQQWQNLKQRQRGWPGGRGRRGPPHVPTTNQK